MVHIDETAFSTCPDCGEKFELVGPPYYVPLTDKGPFGLCHVHGGMEQKRCIKCQVKFRIKSSEKHCESKIA